MQELRDLASFLNVHSVNLLHSGNLSVKLAATLLLLSPKADTQLTITWRVEG